MPDKQNPPNDGGLHPDLTSQQARPSDAEAAHTPDGDAARDSIATPDQRDVRAGENRDATGA